MSAGRIAALVVILLASGCAQNAILELDVNIPGQTVVDGRRWALVEVSDGASDFDVDPFTLQGAVPVDLTLGQRTVEFAIVGSRIDTEVRVRVRYCVDQNCGDFMQDVHPFMEETDPLYSMRRGYRYAFDRSFYIGHVTSYTITVPPASSGTESATVNRICRCAVAGCIGRSATTYCRTDASDPCNDDPRNTHFCE